MRGAVLFAILNLHKIIFTNLGREYYDEADSISKHSDR